jgi:hypothetical protein
MVCRRIWSRWDRLQARRAAKYGFTLTAPCRIRPSSPRDDCQALIQAQPTPKRLAVHPRSSDKSHRAGSAEVGMVAFVEDDAAMFRHRQRRAEAATMEARQIRRSRFEPLRCWCTRPRFLHHLPVQVVREHHGHGRLRFRPSRAQRRRYAPEAD